MFVQAKTVSVRHSESSPFRGSAIQGVRHSEGPPFRGIEITSRGPRKMFGIRQRSIARHGIPSDVKEIPWQHFLIDF